MYDKSTNHGNEVMVVQFFSFSHARFSKKLQWKSMSKLAMLL